MLLERVIAIRFYNDFKMLILFRLILIKIFTAVS